MRYMRLCLLLLLTTGVMAGGGSSDQGLKLHLSSMKKTQLAGELWDFRLRLLNSGPAPAFVEPSLLRVGLEMQVESEWIECRRSFVGTPGVRDLRWQRIDPGAEMSLPIAYYICRKDLSSANADWWDTPGIYAFRASTSHRVPPQVLERSGPAPEGANEWTLDSNILELSVSEPVGIDAQALRWAREHGHYPVSLEVANEFPSSRYAALAVWPLLTIHDGDPEQVKEYIDKGFYPGRSSVPDPSSPDGRRTVSRGTDMASWRIEHGERLLREQQNFPYERDVRLSVAVGYAVLGKKDQAMRLLNALEDEAGTPESQWATRFKTLQGWQ